MAVADGELVMGHVHAWWAWWWVWVWVWWSPKRS